MGRNYLGDIPGNFFAVNIGHNASVASNGAAATLGEGRFVAPANIKVVSLWRTAQVAEGTHADATASYRRVQALNGSTNGAGTVGIGTYNVNASVSQYGSAPFTLAATATLSAGEILVLYHSTVGGDLNDGTILRAGQWFMAYELL